MKILLTKFYIIYTFYIFFFILFQFALLGSYSHLNKTIKINFTLNIFFHILKNLSSNMLRDNILVYVKKGMYKENVEVGKKKTNVMLGGNGMHSTIITCSFNVVDGYATFKSATVAADGDGFIA